MQYVDLRSVPHLRSDAFSRAEHRTVPVYNWSVTMMWAHTTRKRISGHCILPLSNVFLVQVANRHSFSKQSGERIPNAPVEVDKATQAYVDTDLDSHICVCPPTYDSSQCFVDVPELNLGIERRGMIGYMPGDELNVRRLNLAEVRVMVFHANSSAWRNAPTETCRHLGKMIYTALIDQADFILGEGNKFSQRNFKNDTHNDYRSCIIIDMLCRKLKDLNSTRKYEDRTTYEIVPSASHDEWLAGSIGKQHDTDCLICISLHYSPKDLRGTTMIGFKFDTFCVEIFWDFFVFLFVFVYFCLLLFIVVYCCLFLFVFVCFLFIFVCFCLFFVYFCLLHRLLYRCLNYVTN